MYETLTPTRACPPAAPPSPADWQNAALTLFCGALEEVNRLERRPVCSAIEYVMNQLQPDFDLKALGFTGIDALATLAAERGFVRLSRVGAETLVQRHHALRETTAHPPPLAPALYRETLEVKLKCPLLPAPLRKQVFSATAAILESREKASPPISLVDLSYRVESRIGRHVGQNSVFKLLLALVLANAFVIERHPRLHKISILSPFLPVEQWDDLFVESCLVGLRHDRPVWPLHADLLASVLDTSAERLQHLLPDAPQPATRSSYAIPA